MLPHSAPDKFLAPPTTDPTPIFDTFRGNYGTELLVAAIAYFDLFSLLSGGPLSFAELRAGLGLNPRPANVLLTGLAAMKLLAREDGPDGGSYQLTPLGEEHLVPGRPLYVGGYVTQAAKSAGVRGLIDRLRFDRATVERTGATEATGTAFTYRPGTESAMDSDETARSLTMILAGRAKNVAPVLADRLPLPQTKLLLDVGGGTGIYAFALLQRNPSLRAIVWDRAAVLKVAHEMAIQHGVADRVELRPGDMFHDPVPTGCDAMLLSNVLHDWDVPECEILVSRCAAALVSSGRLLIHDVFLNDNLDGPLPVALYSAALFCITEGRAYSGREYRQWMEAAGLSPEPIVPTLVNCGVLVGVNGDR
jgi:hypothetical protein